MYLLQHAKHGQTHVYSDFDLAEHEAHGWLKVATIAPVLLPTPATVAPPVPAPQPTGTGNFSPPAPNPVPAAPSLPFKRGQSRPRNP